MAPVKPFKVVFGAGRRAPPQSKNASYPAREQQLEPEDIAVDLDCAAGIVHIDRYLVDRLDFRNGLCHRNASELFLFRDSAILT